MNRGGDKNPQILTPGGGPRISATLAPPVVLLAEDDPDMRDIIASELRDSSYEVIEAANGIELWSALLQCLEGSDEVVMPDLIISDVRMPGMSGLEALTRLREFDWYMPVIVMTAFGDATVHHKARSLGARVFNKPVKLDQLLSAALELTGCPNDRKA